MTEMCDPGQSKYSLQKLTAVGGVREFRLERDLGIVRIEEVANADISELTQIWSVGETTAMKMKGSAQGFVNAWESYLDRQAKQIAAGRRTDLSGDDQIGRVAVLMRDDFEYGDPNDPEHVAQGVLTPIVNRALRASNVVLDEDTTIGYVGGFDPEDPCSEAGGSVIEPVIDSFNGGGVMVGRQKFETPWSKYAGYFGWYADDEEKPFTEKDYPVFPEQCPDTNEIPFDTPRGLDDLEPGMPARERNQEMIEWADFVVVPVAGDYTTNLLYECRDQQVPVQVMYDVNVTPDGGVTVLPWSDSEAPETLDIEETHSIAGRSGTKLQRKEDVDGNPMTDENGRPVFEEVQVDEADWEDSKEWRAGSAEELDPNDAFTMAPNDSLDERPEIKDQSAGSGVGRGSDRTGEYPDKHL